MTTLVQKLLPHLPLYRRVKPRSFHAFCIGAAKTGTHSLSAMFERHYRAAHEPSSEKLISLLLQKRDGTSDPVHLHGQLAKHDQQLWLEMNASQINGHFAAEWAALFPEARFILTVREPKSWLRSITNHQLARPLSSKLWHEFRRLRFVTDEGHSAEEAPLAEQHLFTLDGYLGYWQWHNQTVLESVPADRLLIIPTMEIGQRLGEIAAFLGISAETLTNAHAYRAKAQFDVIDRIDPDYLQSKIDNYCTVQYQSLMAAANSDQVV